MGVESRQIEKSEFRELPEKREVHSEMAHKFRKACLLPLEVGKRHHSRRSVITEKHREFIDEVANGGLGSFLAVIDLRGKEVIWDFQLIAEIADFFRLGFEVSPVRVGEDIIEHCDAPLNVFDFVLPAIADVLAVDLAVQPAREQVIDRPAFWKAFCPGVFLGVKFVPEGVGSVAPMGGGEGEELARHKVAGMRGYDIEKTGFHVGVAEGLESIDMGRGDVHSERIPAVISRSSRTRRKRDASSGRLYREKPALAFCARPRGL